jgi:uncharacterized membrane protein
LRTKLPKTPSRKAPRGFAARLVTGALCGAAFGLASQSPLGGLLAGVVGSIVGTLGGYVVLKILAEVFSSGAEQMARSAPDIFFEKH